jgi:hypothetical protein
MNVKIVLVAVARIIVLGIPGRLSAQPSSGRVYVSAGSGWVVTESVQFNAGAPGFRLSGGVRLTSWLDVEADLSHNPGTLSSAYTTSVSLAGSGASREERERLTVPVRRVETRESPVAVGAAAVFHPRRQWRVTPAFVLGLTSFEYRSTLKTDILELPVGVTSGQAAQHPSLRDQTWGQSGLALTLGGNVSVALTRHVAVVPEVRLDALGSHDARFTSTVSMRWRF